MAVFGHLHFNLKCNEKVRLLFNELNFLFANSILIRPQYWEQTSNPSHHSFHQHAIMNAYFFSGMKYKVRMFVYSMNRKTTWLIHVSKVPRNQNILNFSAKQCFVKNSKQLMLLIGWVFIPAYPIYCMFAVFSAVYTEYMGWTVAELQKALTNMASIIYLWLMLACDDEN